MTALFNNIGFPYTPFNKYHVAPKSQRTCDNIVFSSKREMERYIELKMMLKAGKISGLELQPEFILISKSECGRDIKYIADFQYINLGLDENNIGEAIVEDVKGVSTKEFKLKWRLVNEKYGKKYNFKIVK